MRGIDRAIRGRGRGRRGGGLAVALSLAGCSLAPPYSVPPSPIAPAYKELGPWQPAMTDVAPAGPWWQAFDDATLSGLEARIEQGNPSLAAAIARYDQARGLLRETQGAQYPSVSLGASGDRARVSADRPLSPGSAATYNDLRIGASLSYEIDLFGRVRNSVRANAAAACRYPKTSSVTGDGAGSGAAHLLPRSRRWPS